MSKLAPENCPHTKYLTRISRVNGSTEKKFRCPYCKLTLEIIPMDWRDLAPINAKQQRPQTVV